MKNSLNAASQDQSSLRGVINKLLRPVIGILIRIGIPFGSFAGVARTIYVDIAHKEFGVQGRNTNASRVAMLTGLTRAKVKQELDYAEAIDDSDIHNLDKVRHASRMLLGWHTDARFLDEHGAPRALPIKGASPSFEELYDSYSGKGVPLTSMLRELISVGAIEKLNDNLIIARTRSYTPKPTDPVSLGRICQSINDHTETALFNLYRDSVQRARFERFATNQLIPANKEEEFRNFLEYEGEQFLERIDNWLTEAEISRDNNQSEDDQPLIRIGAGLYQIRSEPVLKNKKQ